MSGVSRVFVTSLSLLVLGCATGAAGDRQLEARLARLEDRVAQLEAKPARAPTPAPSASAFTHGGESHCERILDAAIPPDTTFPHVVDYEIGRARFSNGDRITISEVRGTRQQFEQGGIYVVKGQYTLASADEASLGFSVTASRSNEGCTTGNKRGYQKISRGTGTFELAVPIQYSGHPHVSFYVAGKGAGGVYFGKGEFLLK